jgi:hypothetical protein
MMAMAAGDLGRLRGKREEGGGGEGGGASFRKFDDAIRESKREDAVLKEKKSARASL